MKNLTLKIHRLINGHISKSLQSVEIVTSKQRVQFSIPFLVQCAGVILLRHIPHGVAVVAEQGASQHRVNPTKTRVGQNYQVCVIPFLRVTQTVGRLPCLRSIIKK